jgi:hypothetical protein
MDLIGSLKKNKEVKEYVINVILDNTTETVDKTVEKVMQLLKEKYDKMTTEKSVEILKEMLDFEMKEEETCETFWDRFQSMIFDCEREKINAKLFYLLGIMMVEKAEKKGK